MAAGILIVGLLVLIPEPAKAVRPAAPSVTLEAVGTTIKTTVITTVTIPAGMHVPLEYAEILFADGTKDPVFSGTLGRMTTAGAGVLLQTCVGTITSWGGATQTFGTFKGHGYGIQAGDYGYGYEFGSAGSEILQGAGYTTGYGYGAPGSDLTVTLTVEASNCPSTALFSGDATFRTFHVQVMVGGSAATVFPGLPATLTLRNPVGFTLPATTADTTPTLNDQVNDGTEQTTFVLQVQAGGSVGGTGAGEEITTGTVTYTPNPNVPTFLESATFTFTQMPDGANVVLSFNDPQTNSGFTTGTRAFGITALDGVPAGFFSLTVNGLAPGQTATGTIDMTIVLSIPDSFFTTNGLSTANFHLARFSDAGVFQENIACSSLGAHPSASPAETRFSCTITSFSSFAMLASAFGTGGGGSTLPTTTTTSTTTGTTTGSESVSGTDVQTTTTSGTGTDTTTGTGGNRRGGSAPGLEFGLLVAGLAGIAFLARRQLK